MYAVMDTVSLCDDVCVLEIMPLIVVESVRVATIKEPVAKEVDDGLSVARPLELIVTVIVGVANDEIDIHVIDCTLVDERLGDIL